jgi:hypothetical protein
MSYSTISTTNPWDPNLPIEEIGCFCGYIEPPPRNLSDRLCDSCEARKAIKAKKDAEELDARVTEQLALPEGDPNRLFTDAELRDTANVHCDKRGFSRVLLRAIRNRLGIPLNRW